MKISSQLEFQQALNSGDIGLICAKNPFAILQSLYAHRFKEGPVGASHAFYLRRPPFITEANGIVIKGPSSQTSVLKYVGSDTKCWIFRYRPVSVYQVGLMNAYADSAEASAGHYSFGGIWQFAKSWISGKQNQSDEGGVFCSEFVSNIVQAAGITDFISDRPSWRIDPTYLLNWLLREDVTLRDWILVGHYDGKNYFLGDRA